MAYGKSLKRVKPSRFVRFRETAQEMIGWEFSPLKNKNSGDSRQVRKRAAMAEEFSEVSRKADIPRRVRRRIAREKARVAALAG